jgi:hypothetical protein
MVKGFRKKEVERVAKRDLAAGTTIVSDGLSCWPAVAAAGCDHRPMRTGSGRRPRAGRRSGGSTGPLGNIKAALVGTYRHVSPKHASTISATSPTASAAASSSTASSNVSPGRRHTPSHSLPVIMADACSG